MNRISEIYKGTYLSTLAHTSNRKRIKWVCDRVQGTKVLDVGCSQGIVPILLARESHQVLGIDIDGDSIGYANNDLAQEPPETREHLSFIRDSIFEIELPECEYDTVIMGELLEHLTNPGRVIEIIYYAMADSGRLIITVPFGIGGSAKQHRQTFYLTSMYKLLYPYFEIEDSEVLSTWLCLAGSKKTFVDTSSIVSMPIQLADKQEDEFKQREAMMLAREKVTEKNLGAQLNQALKKLAKRQRLGITCRLASIVCEIGIRRIKK